MTTYDLISCDVNNTTLHGLHGPVNNSIALAVHVHGTGGDFYSNPFIEPLRKCYQAAGISYLTANFPGYGESAATEDFSAFGRAFEIWIDRLGWKGSIVLQGHSLGALKALNYVTRKEKLVPRIKGLVLLSPFDIVAFYCKGDDKTAAHVRERVAQLDRSKTPTDNIPKDIFDLWSISIKTFSELIVDGGPADQFPSRKGSVGLRLSRIEIPTFIAIGHEDFAAFPSASDVLGQIRSSRTLTVRGIASAQHNFLGGIDELSDAVAHWVKTSLAMR
jgi:pimeloyl-ACP methyl ester carboxylesterase